MLKIEIMKTQLSFTFAGCVLAILALGFTAVSQLSAVPFREIVQVRIAEAAGIPSNRYYCCAGKNGQYSAVHGAWVCPTELLPMETN
jgi:hypothetical protein